MSTPRVRQPPRTAASVAESHSLRQLISRDIGESVSTFLTVTFHQLDGHEVCQITSEPSDHPVYVPDGQSSSLYLRVGNATPALRRRC